MTAYKHTQIGYLMLVVSLVVFASFVWSYLTVRAEVASVDSGTNLLVTFIMLATLLLLASFATLTVSIDDKYLMVKFGYGLFGKKFLLQEIVSATAVSNHWYYGWGIRLWFWPKMLIYNVSGFKAVEIATRDGKIYRIGTDDQSGLESAIKRAISA